MPDELAHHEHEPIVNDEVVPLVENNIKPTIETIKLEHITTYPTLQNEAEVHSLQELTKKPEDINILKYANENIGTDYPNPSSATGFIGITEVDPTISTSMFEIASQENGSDYDHEESNALAREHEDLIKELEKLEALLLEKNKELDIVDKIEATNEPIIENYSTTVPIYNDPYYAPHFHSGYPALTKGFQSLLEKHQNPESCSTARYLVWKLNNKSTDLFSDLLSAIDGFASALEHNRIFIYENHFWKWLSYGATPPNPNFFYKFPTACTLMVKFFSLIFLTLGCC